MDYQEAIENYNWLEVEFEKLKAENEALKETNGAWIMAHNDLALELSRVVTENEALKARLTELAQEPVPVMYSYTDPKGNIGISMLPQERFEPVYAMPPDASKRIVETEAVELKDKLLDEIMVLKQRINNGIRVTAINHPSGLVGFMEDAPTFDDKDRTNALLILDEVE
jgi:hypothetical protein